MKVLKNNIITALDIGSYKISGSVFQTNFDAFQYPASQKPIRCLSSQIQKTKGFANGAIVHFNDFEACILDTLHLLEQESKHNIRNLYVSLPGHIFNSSFITKKVTLDGVAVTQSIIQRLIYDSYHQDKNQEIIHITPISYDLDDVKNIEDPKKMVGQELTAYLHVMSLSKTFLNNLKNLFARYDLNVLNFLASPVAHLLSMHPDEQGLLIDFGHDATNVILYKKDTLVFHESIPLGGHLLSQEIASSLQISLEQAERLKSYNGYVSSSDIELAVGGEVFTRHDHNFIIRVYIQELMHLIKKRLDHFDSEFTKNVTITGGSCELKGLSTYVSDIFRSKVRVLSTDEGFQSPNFTACLGTIRYGYYHHCNTHKTENFSPTKNWWHKVKNWFNEDL